MAKFIEADTFVKDNLIAIDTAMRIAEKNGKLKEAVYLYEKAVKSVLKNVEYAPAADVRPNVRGKWIEMDGYDGDVYYDCSACGNSWTTIEGTPWDNGMNFCPNCGADMRKVKSMHGKTDISPDTFYDIYNDCKTDTTDDGI